MAQAVLFIVAPVTSKFILSSKKCLLKGKLIESFKILNGFTNVDPTKVFKMNDSTQTRTNGAKLKCRQVHSDCTEFFTNAVCCSRLEQITNIRGAV